MARGGGKVGGLIVGASLVLLLMTVGAIQRRKDVDVAGQRVGPDGQLVWGEERSATISSSGLLERNISAVSDGKGGAIVAYEMEWREGKQAGDIDIGAQRVSVDGKLMWNEGERSTLVASTEWRECNPVVVSDGAGGAIVVFEMEGPPGGKHAGDIDIGAQRLSPDGKLLWGEPLVPVSSSAMIERNPTAVADGRGGVIVFFEMVAREGEYAGDVEIGAQRIDAEGNRVWQKGERSVLVATSRWDERKPKAVSDGKGGALVLFEMHQR